MLTSHSILRRVLVAAAVAAPAVAAAQGPASTGLAAVGATDPSWQIALNGGAYYPAYVLGRAPSVPGVYRWLGATPSGTVPGGVPDGWFYRDAYSFRTTFLGTGLLSVAYQCAYDDAFATLRLNGVAVATGCDQYSFGATRTLTGFVAGTNTLQIDVSGNGVTDGLAFNVTDVRTASTTTPEPASVGLLGAGLVALFGAVHHRNARRAR